VLAVSSDGNIEAIHRDRVEMSLQASVIYVRGLGRRVQHGAAEGPLSFIYQNTRMSESRFCVCENIPNASVERMK
jgi:hypothetical protein